MNTFEWIAGQVEQSGSLLAHWILTTPSDKLDWKPMPVPESNPRTPLEFVAEVIRVNRGIALRLLGEAPVGSEETMLATAEEAAAEARASAKELAAAIRCLDDSVFERTYEMPWGPARGAMLLSVASWHAIYHGGQLNYIQTLYGDTVFHYPDS